MKALKSSFETFWRHKKPPLPWQTDHIDVPDRQSSHSPKWKCPVCAWSGESNPLEKIEEDGCWPDYPATRKSAANVQCFRCVVIATVFETVLAGSRKRIQTFSVSTPFAACGTQDALEPQEDSMMGLDHHNPVLRVFTTEEQSSTQGGSTPGSDPQFFFYRQNISSGDTSSILAVNWAKEWINFCSKTHVKCQSRGPQSLPSRLLDVLPLNDAGDIRLLSTIDISDPAASYVALSHCWGNITQFTTTAETIESRKRGIPFASLPKTFQDAVVFTRNLGIKYLWIDSLAIIQGDKTDWNREAGRMAEVYGNAHVVLAAAHAKDSSEGLFAKCPEKYRPFKLPPINFEGHMYQLYAAHVMPSVHSWHFDGDRQAPPLFLRSWSYQERLLAPRVIYFTETELQWECHQATGCECWEGESTQYIREDSPKIQHFATVDVRSSTATLEDIRRRWYEIIYEYSGLDLTIKSDKLDALSAIARNFQEIYSAVCGRPGLPYLAGLWFDDLPNTLFWFRNRFKVPSSERTGCAPSWSWASVTGTIEHPARMYERRDMDDQDAETHIEIVDVSCSPSSDSNPFGSVSHGRLVLKSRVVDFKVQVSRSKSECPIKLKHPNLEKSFPAYNLWTDCSHVDSLGSGFGDGGTLRIVRGWEREYQYCHLVLVKDAQTGIHHRIGVMFEMTALRYDGDDDVDVDSRFDNIRKLMGAGKEEIISIE